MRIRDGIVVLALLVACGGRSEGPEETDEERAARCNAVPAGEPCPEGCVQVDPWGTVEDGVCNRDPVDSLCVAFGDEPPPEPSATYYRRMPDGKVRYLPHGQACTHLEGVPLGWGECVGAEDEPLGCWCYEQRGVEPWERMREAMDACYVEEPCGTYDEAYPRSENDFWPEYEPEFECLLEHLRDRVTGVYTRRAEGPFSDDPYKMGRVYVSGDRGVFMSANVWPESSEEELCEFNPYYFMPFQMELESPEFFGDCLAADDWASRYDCVTYFRFNKIDAPKTWVREPVCP